MPNADSKDSKGRVLMLRTGALMLLVVCGGAPLLALLQGMLYATDASVIDLAGLLQAPGTGHWFGTDELGRDVLARAASGLGLSVSVALSVGLLTALIGIPLGLLAGWRRGWLDGVLVRVADAVLSFPGLLLALALAAVLGPSAVNVVLALSVLGWVGFFRLTRVQVLALRSVPYVQAAQLSGLPEARVLARHVLPNIAGALVVEAVIVIAGTLVAEAGLSFLGLGVPPPAPSLGGMIREGVRYILLVPHLVIVPAVMLFCLVVGVNLAAEGLRQRFGGSQGG